MTLAVAPLSRSLQISSHCAGFVVQGLDAHQSEAEHDVTQAQTLHGTGSGGVSL